MCGISGFIDFKKQSDLDILNKMNNTMVHRGPDGFDTFLDNNYYAQIGFGHRRLSIIELSELGKQPMHFEHFTIVFNGEIYNHHEIKVELESLGHQFKSHSDTEVILHTIQQWGVSGIHRFIGMFAFAIYNQKDQTILFVRDRAGIKPLFYYEREGLFLFGSELKVFIEHPRFQKTINLNAVSSYLQYGYVPTPSCIYNNTNKLEPGHYMILDLKTQTKTIKQYWNVYDAYNKPKLKIDFSEAKNETEKLLISACNYRMVSDVPVGVFLSGGYDSTAVTALLQKDKTEKLKTFTIGFQDEKLNEAGYAKQVAHHLGTDHTEYYCTEKEALEIVPTLPFYYDEPFADSSAIPTSLVSKIARQKVTVALSADAGDEVFAGYNRYDYIMKFGGKIKSIPHNIRKGMASVMSAINADNIPVLRNKYLFHSRYEKVKQFLKQADDYHMNQVLSKQFLESDIDQIMIHPTQKLMSAFDSKELSEENYSTLSYIMAIDYETYLIDDILQKVDRATMAHSLEGREPFLDHRIIEWAATLPTEYKYHQGIKKYILREITHQYVPKEIMERPKMGFAIPIAQWLFVDLKHLVDYYFSEQYLKNQSIFKIKETQKIIHDFYHGKKERAEKIWYLLMFQMWYDKWMK
ncbi:MAG: asparagine synthase (glutamine-hydrolyzing) [Chitinophagaceae bacterium]|nr:MAG: asparagine synthase [Bacteroidetes bacterium OLB11]MCC6447533.1 asparagine synthase (glutamine-hydrolyzing) [Chitinophagaceae bacterium]HMN31962.1 asparagine synthase (glutamine-hydrolyzing) [Chitinophagaceae bacterium]